MKKKVVFAILTAMFILAGCEDKGTAQTKAEPTTAAAQQQTAADDTAGSSKGLSPVEIYDKISSTYDVKDLYLGDDDWILNYYGLEAGKLDGYVCAEGDEIHADRVFIIKLKDQADAEGVKEKLNAIYEQLSSPEMLDYLPDQADTIKAGRVVSSGSYVYLLISPDADGIEAIIKEGIAAN